MVTACIKRDNGFSKRIIGIENYNWVRETKFHVKWLRGERHGKRSYL